tara:strand:- start:64 stop:954 length:891 start_codon:yes stop_codon:yes gene_type:complete
MFQCPIPNENELIHYYGDTYYAYEKPKTDFKVNFLELKNLGVHLNKSFLKHYKGYSHLNIRNSRIFGFLGKLLSEFLMISKFPNYIDSGRLLDYGSGAGDFVSFARHVGWIAEGIEFNKEAAKVGEKAGLDIYHGSIDFLQNKNEYYDCIVTSHCVEHVPNVKRLFNAFYNGLKKGGKLLIEIPNGDALAFKKYKEYHYYLGLPVHVNLFSNKSIRIISENAGFTIKSIRSYNRIITQAYSLELLNREKKQSSKMTSKYKKSGYLKSFFFIIKALLTSYNWDNKNNGDCLIIELEK